MIKLIIIILYLHLPYDMWQIDFISNEAECYKIGNFIVSDVKGGDLVVDAYFYCTGDDLCQTEC